MLPRRGEPAAAGGLPGPVPIVFGDRGCPFAHRVLALLAHLGVAPDLHESAVGERPAGLEHHSRSGRIPLLVHGELTLSESRVMLEHLAEYYGLPDALPAALPARSLHRHAMALCDGFIVPLLARPQFEPDRARLAEVLDALEAATATAEPGPHLLSFHVAPIWLRFRWWQPEGFMTHAIAARPVLCAWLDAATQLEGVRTTSPQREAHMTDLARARRLGLMDAFGREHRSLS